jgi:hypothetical protein
LTSEAYFSKKTGGAYFKNSLGSSSGPTALPFLSLLAAFSTSLAVIGEFSGRGTPVKGSNGGSLPV